MQFSDTYTMKKFTSQLNKSELELKNELKTLGHKLQSQSKDFGNEFKSVLESEYEKKQSKNGSHAKAVKVKFSRPFGLGRLLAPAGIVLGLILIVWTISSYTLKLGQNVESDIAFKSTISEEQEEIDYSQGMIAEMSLGDAANSRRFGSLRTFRNRFLDALGQHQASPQDIAERGTLLEQDIKIGLISPKKDCEQYVENIFQSLGGFVENIHQSYNRQNSFTFKGKVPSVNIEALRIMLKDYAGAEKYYQEFAYAESRTADIIKIEEETKKVEDAIEYLKGAIATEQNSTKKTELEQKLQENLSYLAERQATGKDIQDRIDYADVTINLTKIPSWHQAKSFQELKTALSGFNDLTIGGQIILNILFGLVIIISILSYTFWILIIVGVWLIWRKRKTKEKWEDLE